MFFKLLREAFKVKQVRSKILFTIFIVFVFRIGTSITVPWVNANSLNALSGLSFLNMLSLVSGNAMKNFSVFALVLLFSIPLGILVAFCVQVHWKLLHYMIDVYIWVMRGTPLLLQLIFIYYVLPSIGIRLDRVPAAIIGQLIVT